MADESLADRLNRLAQQQKEQHEAETHVQKTQEQVNEFILKNASPEFQRLLDIVGKKVEQVNPSLLALPLFEWRRNGAILKQGNVAAFFSFHQAFTNAGPILFHVSFGREPDGFYLEGFSEPPEPERYQLHAAMAHEPERILWAGDLGEMSSETLADFVLTHLTEYYLCHKPI